ncbi:hypothetical protein EV356DRAFT_564776 [Viridothelium virens]|uniref:Uncharacterized protein n=1 Tax=Viridothelium virens TaxID=1048519 RepID=A0A6A6HH09_VIRVR|nr:hypothetical protein EV356DRAFT_564776 [Viridothelium virens]
MSDAYKSANEVRRAVSESSHMEDNDLDLEKTSFDIELDKAGETGGYHTNNNLKEPWQRETVTERRSSIDIRYKSHEIVHGKLGPESEDFASLLVYDFHFDSTKRFRRIALANIIFEFSSLVPGMPGPKIHAISPSGRCSLLPTARKETFTQESNVKADAGQMGISLGGSYKWLKTVDLTIPCDTRLTGETVCNQYGDQIGVNWILRENEDTKSGVPSFIRSVILLKRQYNNIFQATVKIKVVADWRTEITRLFGSRAKDDPVLFDPSRPPTKKLHDGYDLDDLGSTNLEDICDITFQTNFDVVIKAHVSNSPKKRGEGSC